MEANFSAVIFAHEERFLLAEWNSKSAVALVGSREMNGSGLVNSHHAYLYTLSLSRERQGEEPTSATVRKHAAFTTGHVTRNRQPQDRTERHLKPPEGFSHHLGIPSVPNSNGVHSPELVWLSGSVYGRRRGSGYSQWRHSLFVYKPLYQQDLQQLPLYQ